MKALHMSHVTNQGNSTHNTLIFSPFRRALAYFAGLNRKDTWFIVCSLSVHDTLFCSGNISDIAPSIHQASHQVEFRDCPVCYAPAGPNSCFCVQWTTVSDHFSQHPWKKSVFEMRFTGQYEGYTRACCRDPFTKSLAVVPGVKKSLSSASWSSDQASSSTAMVRLLIQDDLRRHVPAAMPFAVPCFDRDSFFDDLSGQCMPKTTSAVIAYWQQKSNLDALECKNSCDPTNLGIHDPNIVSPAFDMIDGGGMRPTKRGEPKNSNRVPVISENAAEGRMPERWVPLPPRDQHIDLENFQRTARKADNPLSPWLTKLDQNARSQDDSHFSSMNVRDHTARIAQNADKERAVSISECLVPPSAQGNSAQLAYASHARLEQSIPSPRCPPQYLQQQPQPVVVPLSNIPSISLPASLVAAAAAAGEAAAAAVYRAACILPEDVSSWTNIEQQPSWLATSAGSAGAVDVEKQIAEEHERKAHARKMRCRVAALQANKRRSEKYSKLVSDVSSRRDTLTILGKREALLRSENVRIRKLVMQMSDFRGQVHLPSSPSANVQPGKGTEDDRTGACSAAPSREAGSPMDGRIESFR
jgi:hypothetical protein